MSNTDSTTPEVPAQTPVITDMGFAINQIAEANNQIRTKESTIETLEKQETDLKNSINALEINKKNLEEENNKKFEDGKYIGIRKEEMLQVASENMEKETKELEALRIEIAGEKETLQKEREEVEAGRAEADRVRLDNEKVSAELESKIIEAKRLSGNREGQISEAKAEREASEVEAKRTQILKEETTQVMEENKIILEKITEAREGAEVTFEAIRKEREENERIKTIAQAEVGSADFIKNEAHRLVMIFRQALHTFISVNGSVVRIPDLKEEDLIFVIKDLIEQCPSFDYLKEFPLKDPKSSEETEEQLENMTKPQLVMKGRELFGIEMSMDLGKLDMVATLEDAKRKKAVTE